MAIPTKEEIAEGAGKLFGRIAGKVLKAAADEVLGEAEDGVRAIGRRIGETREKVRKVDVDVRVKR